MSIIKHDCNTYFLYLVLLRNASDCQLVLRINCSWNWNKKDFDPNNIAIFSIHYSVVFNFFRFKHHKNAFVIKQWCWLLMSHTNTEGCQCNLTWVISGPSLGVPHNTQCVGSPHPKVVHQQRHLPLVLHESGVILYTTCVVRRP